MSVFTTTCLRNSEMQLSYKQPLLEKHSSSISDFLNVSFCRSHLCVPVHGNSVLQLSSWTEPIQ